MRRWLSFLFVLGLSLVFSLDLAQAAEGTCCPPDWKLPLPAGEWLITQGDKDSCSISHCAGSGAINEYALDIVAGSGRAEDTLGQNILAPAAGKVIARFWDRFGGGNVLKIEHGEGGPVTIYIHLKRILVEKGMYVKQGDSIALIGKSGRGWYRPHLHMVVFKSKTERVGLKITSWDGQTNFATGVKLVSTNSPILQTDRIAFVSDRDGNQEIYLMELVGSTVVSLTNLTNNPADDYDPAWSPDGTRLAFRSNRNGDRGIFIMQADGSNVIYFSGDLGDYSWSPDSKHIAFSCCGYGDSSIFVANSDGSGITQLSDGPNDHLPSWSLDGANIIFSRNIPPSYSDDIYIMNVDGSSITYLSSGPWFMWVKYTLFPDNERISFQSLTPGAEDPYSTLYITNIYDTEITPAEMVIGQYFTFAPDFTHGLTSYPIDKNCKLILECSYGIFLIDVDDSSATCLNCNNPDSGDWHSAQFSWSPDGTRIAFGSGRDGDDEIYIMNVDGSNQVNLTNNPANDWDPGWSPEPGKVIPIASPSKVPTISTPIASLNLSDPESIVYWLAYDMAHGTTDSFSQVLTEDTLEYGTGFAGGRVEIDRATFFDELGKRIMSKPACVIYDINEDKTYITIWTKGWRPLWEFYVEWAGKLETSEEIKFSFMLYNGQIYTTAYFFPSSAIFALPEMPKLMPCPAFD